MDKPPTPSRPLPRLAEHFSGCFSPAPGPITLDTAIREAATLLANEAEQLTRQMDRAAVGPLPAARPPAELLEEALVRPVPVDG